MGWFAYEMKEESLQGYHRKPERKGDDAVDACWAWCDWILERSSEGEWIIRGLLDETIRDGHSKIDQPTNLVEWLESAGITPGLTSTAFENLVLELEEALTTNAVSQLTPPAPAFPRFSPLASGRDYAERIGRSRESIRQGDSYELNLTTSFHSSLPPSSDPYSMYLRLRSFNPAYYSTYMSFPSLATSRGQGIHVLSSSPERFLKIERTRGDGRMVEMMPIKGTRARVKPGQCVCGPDTGCKRQDIGGPACVEEGKREDERRGNDLQADLKERAENLMVNFGAQSNWSQLTRTDCRLDSIRFTFLLSALDCDCTETHCSRELWCT